MFGLPQGRYIYTEVWLSLGYTQRFGLPQGRYIHICLVYLRVGIYTQMFGLPQGMYIHTDVWYSSGYANMHRGLV